MVSISIQWQQPADSENASRQSPAWRCCLGCSQLGSRARRASPHLLVQSHERFNPPLRFPESFREPGAVHSPPTTFGTRTFRAYLATRNQRTGWQIRRLVPAFCIQTLVRPTASNQFRTASRSRSTGARHFLLLEFALATQTRVTGSAIRCRGPHSLKVVGTRGAIGTRSSSTRGPVACTKHGTPA